MKITNAQLVGAVNAVRYIGSLALPVKTSFKMAKVIKALEAALVPYNETYQKIVEECVAKDEAGNRIEVLSGQVKLTDAAVFDAKVKDLMALDTEIDMPTISMAELDGQSIQANLLVSIDWLLAE